MGRAEDLTTEEKAKIDAFITCELSFREIGRRIGRTHNVVINYVNNRETYGTNRSNNRPEVMTTKEKRRFLRDISNTGDSINKVRVRNDISASKTTCWRQVNKSENLKHLKMKQKPPFKPCHIENRLKWAETKMGWTSQWRSVIFSDEKKFNKDGPDGYKMYWHDLRKEPRWFSKRVCGGGSVMVWGAVGYNGKTDLVIFDVNNTSLVYIDIVRKQLFTYAQRIAGENWIFQHDKSGVHNSGLVNAWFAANYTRVLEWPPLSPDLNIIENVWSEMVRIVYSNGRQYQTTNDLKQAIFDAWEEISQDYIKTLFESMPHRVYELISKHDNKINY